MVYTYMQVVICTVLLSPCILISGPLVQRVIALGLYMLGVRMGMFALYAETQHLISMWIGVQLIEIQRRRLQQILHSLIPAEMADMILQDQEALPCRVCREERAVVLHLDLRNYMSLTASSELHQLAATIQRIFVEFDHLIETIGAPCSVFRIDTIGDAFEAAAWLAPSATNSTAAQDAADALTCDCMLRLGEALVGVVKDMGLECRAGVASGHVVAGMLGKLQPRFHLLGWPVIEAQRLEAAAQVNQLNVCPDLLSLVASAPLLSQSPSLDQLGGAKRRKSLRVNTRESLREKQE